MKQREVTDNDKTTWTCVQALSGMSKESADEAEERLESDSGTVPVVCTPRGGARSVRLELATDWETSVSDDALVEKISAARD
ncbi:MAG TPA: hypothetical protein VF614_07950 [Chthoniobacteraceae bacterium]|jgi:hypothetical protein